MELAKNKFAISAEQMSKKYQNYEQECKDEYLNTLQEAAQTFQEQISSSQTELKQLEDKLADKKALVAAAVAAQKR